MNRPARKHKHLVEKLERKISRSRGEKPGKKAKRWRRWAEAYKDLVAA